VTGFIPIWLKSGAPQTHTKLVVSLLIQDCNRQTEINIHRTDVRQPASGQLYLWHDETRNQSADDYEIVAQIAKLGRDVETRFPNQLQAGGRIGGSMSGLTRHASPN
jgi:hypothetical protein